MPKTQNHNHIKISNHSPNQQRMFFALVNTLGYNADELKERATAKFKKDCFNDLTTSDMTYLIDKLVGEQERRIKKQSTTG